MTFDAILDVIKTKAAQAEVFGKTLKLDFGESRIFIDGTGTENVVSTEDKDADCTVSISEENLQALIAGTLKPMMAFMSGKIKVKGDMGLAMKLQSFF